MGSLRDWLQLGRFHTAPATVLALVVPYLLAGGRDPLVVLSLFAIGHLAHFFSFGHNSLMDYYVDVEDPNKAHHPLPSGRIKLEDATKVILYGQVLTFLLLSLMILLLSLSPVLSLFFLWWYFAWGHAYNDGLDHRSVHSWLPISLCYAGFSLVTYTFVRGLDIAALLVFTWAFLFEVYDIGLLGNVKDIWNPAERLNPLRGYVVYGSDGSVWGLRRGILALFWLLRAVASSFILYLIAFVLRLPLVNIAMLSALTFIEVLAVTATCLELAPTGPVNRSWLLSLFGLSEAIEFFRLTSLAPALPALLLMLYGLAYFVLFNRLLWGTRLGPRV
jgi:hypothetical protein